MATVTRVHVDRCAWCLPGDSGTPGPVTHEAYYQGFGDLPPRVYGVCAAHARRLAAAGWQGPRVTPKRRR